MAGAHDRPRHYSVVGSTVVKDRRLVVGFRNGLACVIVLLSLVWAWPNRGAADRGPLKMLASEEGVNVVYVSLAIFAVGTCWLWTYWRPPGGGN